MKFYANSDLICLNWGACQIGQIRSNLADSEIGARLPLTT